MTNCIPELVRFPRCKGREVEARFSGGAITSNGGAVLLREADRMLGLTEQAARVLADPRRKASCRHTTLSMLRQRVFGLALGEAVRVIAARHNRRPHLALDGRTPAEVYFAERKTEGLGAAA